MRETGPAHPRHGRVVEVAAEVIHGAGQSGNNTRLIPPDGGDDDDGVRAQSVHRGDYTSFRAAPAATPRLLTHRPRPQAASVDSALPPAVPAKYVRLVGRLNLGSGWRHPAGAGAA
jgi:hypothetical protein